VYLIVAGVVAVTTAATLRNDILPPFKETQQSVKEDVAWIRNDEKSQTK
jgi:hypothetical protein